MPVAVILFLQWLSAGSSPDAMKELRTLLERTEAAPLPPSGQIDSVIEQIDPVAKTRTMMDHTRREYVIDGNKMMIRATYLEDKEQRYPDSLECDNGRYCFHIIWRGGKWLLDSTGYSAAAKGARALPLIDFLWSFKQIHTVHDRRLSDLLAAPEFGVTALRVGPRMYLLVGRRSAESTDMLLTAKTTPQPPFAPSREMTDALLTFSARVIVAADGKYAYITGLSYKWTASGQIVEMTTENSVREGPEGPRLVTVVEKYPSSDKVGLYEYRKNYTDGPASAPGPEEYTLSQFGLPEPDLESWTRPPAPGPGPAADPSRYLWLLILPFLGVLCLLIGRWMAFRVQRNKATP
jgi:hypothetical protein